MRIFPNAKVVLTVRDPERWYESVRGTIYQTLTFLHGTVGLFLKMVGQHRRMSIIVGTSLQGPPVNPRGILLF
jgi:hypothetical protein